MKRVYIVHGYGGNPEKNWFPWLKGELKRESISVTVPAMPHTDTPALCDWLPYLHQVIGTPDENTYIIGHSLGCITILRYLESLEEGVTIGGAILVAGFASPIHYTELNNFFETPLKAEKIKRSARKIFAISSDNDERTSWAQSEELRDKFGAELIKIHNGGHLNERAGYKEFPLLLEELKKLIDNK